jgi:hypothetical protein
MISISYLNDLEKRLYQVETLFAVVLRTQEPHLACAVETLCKDSHAKEIIEMVLTGPFGSTEMSSDFEVKHGHGSYSPPLVLFYRLYLTPLKA